MYEEGRGGWGELAGASSLWLRRNVWVDPLDDQKKPNISKAGGQAQADITQKDRQRHRQNLVRQQQ